MDGMGTLGGPGTFAAQAASVLLANHHEFDDEMKYFPTLDAVWDALASEKVSAIVLGAETQRTGFVEGHIHRLAAKDCGTHVLDEIIVPYGCCLIAKPGTLLNDIELIVGHGSILQCHAFFSKHVPHVKVERHPESSYAASLEVAANDDPTAVVATRATAELTGLEVIAEEIDGNAVASWWLFGSEPNFKSDWQHLVVAGTFGYPGDISSMLSTHLLQGWSLRNFYSAPTGRELFEVDVIIVFGDRPSTANLNNSRQGLEPFEGTRLLGVF